MTQSQTPIAEQQDRIRALNDQFRQDFSQGTVLITRGIKHLPVPSRGKLIAAVRNFSDFTEDNDPHGEHDFGSFTVDGYKVFWKIDYYGPDMMHRSQDAADPTQTRRVLTIMLADEY